MVAAIAAAGPRRTTAARAVQRLPRASGRVAERDRGGERPDAAVPQAMPRLAEQWPARRRIEAGESTRRDAGTADPDALLASFDAATIYLQRADSGRPYAFVYGAPRDGPCCTAKRVFDVAFATVGLVILLPLLLVTALAVKLDSPGPVFFRQWRGGLNGCPFRILKFRTMSCMEDGAQVLQARRLDSRITPVGKVLRRFSIDEFPQLINVLKGEMSMVGPRPHALAHDATFGRLIGDYPARQLVRPGITGLAQVNGCRGETRELAAMTRRVEQDLEYIRNWSFVLDLRILVQTVSELVWSTEAY